MRPPRQLRAVATPSKPGRRPARNLIVARAPPLAVTAKRRARPLMRRLVLAVAALLALAALLLTTFRIAAMLRETATAAALAPASGRFVETGHGRMFLQDQGARDGLPIVLVHGTAAWSEFWRGTIDHLVARGHRVIALDLPPFGFSERSRTGAYSRLDQARRIKGALDALDVKRALFVGHSFGAGATVETIMLHPERAAGLVLVAAALALPDDGQTAADVPASTGDALLALPLLPEAIVATTLTNPLLTRSLLATMIARKDAATEDLAFILRRPMSRVGTTSDFVVWARGFIRPDRDAVSMRPHRYRALSTPTQIIWGDRDTLTPLAQGERLARLIPGAGLEILPTLGHIPQIEGPSAFRAALDRALDAIAVASAAKGEP